ncbi:RDD family protein [Sulfuriferula sp.]|uniref:RDD family protein n=1 Tax=Sulfuriferula sp. TaxID=2025307 RepID=UPI002731A2C3|nr:RDD family protein [Sulfuriferula sp.]MDP2025501.1 RDD family protein [Sulfuriferula sp.]
MLDTYRAIETPEGVELRLRVAGPVARSLAWVIDLLIRGGVYVVLAIAMSQLGKFGIGLLLLSLFLFEWFYPVLFEVYQHGQTPGKRALGLRVVDDDGAPVGWSASMIRNLLRFVDFLPVMYGFGLVSMLLHGDFKRLGDIAAGTRVVYQDGKSQPPTVPDDAAQAPRQRLTLDEQRAVISFAERARSLSPERTAELAGIVAPQATPTAAIHQLYATANWLLGKQR